MAIIKLCKSVVARLQVGLSILAAARTINSKLISARLAAFEAAQNGYQDAHEKVGGAEMRQRTAKTATKELVADLRKALQAVIRGLINDGQPRLNPFEAFGVAAPAALMALPIAEKAQTIHRLVAAIQREAEHFSKATLDATQALDAAVQAVERGMSLIESRGAAVLDARHARDAAGKTWTNAFRSLKRGARAAFDDGGAQIYEILFDRPNPPRAKAAKPTPTAGPAPATPPLDAAT